MPDASGTPTSPDNIPTFNTAVDPPSGKGFNTAMAQIQAIITELKAGTLPSGKINAAAALTGLVPTANLGSGTANTTTFLRGDQSYAIATQGPNKITTSLMSGGPPASPSDGDIWVATGVGSGLRWTFQYNAGSASPYKWEFIGGPVISTFVAGEITITSASQTELSTSSRVFFPRAGDYNISASASVRVANTSTLGQFFLTGFNASGVGILGERVGDCRAVGASDVRCAMAQTFRCNDMVINGYASVLGANGSGDSTIIGFSSICVWVEPIRIS